MRAPLEFWRKDKLSAFVFLGVNLFVGTIGIWLPPFNSLFGGTGFLADFFRHLDTGEIYVFGITFLCAVTGTTFTSMAKDNVEHSRHVKAWLGVISASAVLVSVLLLQSQLLIKPTVGSPPLWVTYTLQVLVGAFTSLAAIYVHSIVSIEIYGSVRSDVDDAAKELLERSEVTQDRQIAWDNS